MEDVRQVPSSIPVVVVGGGPVGLVVSILLSQAGVPHILFSRHATTAIHPKAVGLNQRTTETFSRLGVLDAVYAAAAPVTRSTRTAWYTSLGPEGREICSRDAWGGGHYAAAYADASPCRYVLLPQVRLEPIIKARAEEANPSGVLFGWEVLRVNENGDKSVGVGVRVRRRETGEEFEVQAEYVVGADGGRFLADSLGFRWEGERDIVHMVSAHVRAPLSRYHPDPSIFLSWFINPELGGSLGTGYCYHLGEYTEKGAEGNPWATTEEKEEWMFACGVHPSEPRAWNWDDMKRRMHSVLRIPELEENSEVQVLSLTHWHVHAIVTDKYRSPKGRVFLVGDAAHRIPPWGALGLNTGIADAENLVWKLARALKKAEIDPTTSRDGLLDTYEQERRPIGVRVARDSLHNMRSHADVLDRAIGIRPDRSVAANVQAMATYFDRDSAAGAQQRQAVERALYVLDLEFMEHGAEIGWFYPSADVNAEGKGTRHDGQLLDESGGYDVRNYHPSTIPGHHLPHAWLVGDGGSGARVSTRALIRHDKFLLITSASAVAWRDVRHADVDVVVIGEEEEGGHGWRDETGQWAMVRGVSASGALLVRPDGIVAFRWHDDSAVEGGNPSDVIEEVLRGVLRQP